MTQALEVMNPKLKTLQDLFTKYREQLALAMPDHMAPEKLIRLALTAISNNPKLLECTPKSLMRCMMYSAEFGLEPGPFGLCYYVPFKNNKENCTEAVFIPGYKGVLKLVRNSGELRTVMVEPVYEQDTFHVSYGLKPDLTHTPSFKKDRGALLSFYCVILLKDGGAQFKVMSLAEVEAHRDEFSQSFKTSQKFGKGDSAWETDFNAMACKTALLKTAKLCPISKEAQNLLAVEEAGELGIEQPAISVSTIPPYQEPQSNGEESAVQPGKPRKRKLATSTSAVVMPGYIPEWGNRPVNDPAIPLGVLKEALMAATKRLNEGYPENRQEMGDRDKSLAGALQKAIDGSPSQTKGETKPVEAKTEMAKPGPESNALVTARTKAVAESLQATELGKSALFKQYDNFRVDHWNQVGSEQGWEFCEVLEEAAKSLNITIKTEKAETKPDAIP